MADVLVIVPCYNERANLPGIIARLRTSVPDADVLVIDDASPDGTGALADSLAERDARVSVLHRQKKQGLGVAYQAGFDYARLRGYDFVVEIDADGSHDPAELPRMLDLARNGNDLVIGSRWVPGGTVLHWPWIRRAISRAGNNYARLMLRSRVKDMTSGFRVFRASSLRALDRTTVSSQGYCFQVELAWRLELSGARIAEHPIVFVEREAGRSKMHAGIVAEALFRVTLWGARARLSRRPPTA